MRYVSTRGKARALGFEEALLAGLAEDGGLYLPDSWQSLGDVSAPAGLTYAELALQVITPFVGGEVEAAVLARMTREAYAEFDHPDVAPLRALGNGEYLLELFHGPTLSFKDYALQLVGRLFD